MALPARRRAASVGYQALAAELVLRLGERGVARRHDHVRADELVVGDRTALGRDELEQLLELLSEGGLVVGVTGRDHRIVQLVQPVALVVGELVLPLARDADDHFSPCSSAAGSSPPFPISDFIFASSSSTCWPALSCSSWRSMSSWAGPRCVMSSNVPAFSSSSTAWPRAFIVATLSSARCIARPRSAICSPTPVAASEIWTWASAAEYCALMTSFLVRKASIFVRSFCSFSVRDCCWASSSVTCWSSDWSSVWATVLRSRAARARSSRPCARAWRACVSSFTICCSSLSDCIWRRFLEVTTSAMPFLTFWSSSSCLL